jgi:hypothetical protein
VNLGCGFFGFALDSHFCQIFFDSVVMNLDLALQPAVYFFKAARALDVERAHFCPEPIFDILSFFFVVTLYFSIRTFLQFFHGYD